MSHSQTMIKRGYALQNVPAPERVAMNSNIECIRSLYRAGHIKTAYAMIDKLPTVKHFIETMDLTYCEYCEASYQ